MKKTIVVTGGTGGIGLQTSIRLARSGHRLVMTGRDHKRGERSIRMVRELTGNDDVHLAIADLASLRDTHGLARELGERFQQIDVLINNAGALANKYQLTVDGIEANFAINAITPYVLTHALLDSLKPGTRVINVTGGLPLGGLDPTNLQAQNEYVGMVAYSHSKRALEAMSIELAKELEPRGVNVLTVFPGVAATAMSGSMTIRTLPWWMWPIWPIFRLTVRDDGGKSAAKASRSSVWAATSADLEGVSGRAFDSNAKPLKLHSTVLDEAIRAKVIASIKSIATGK